MPPGSAACIHPLVFHIHRFLLRNSNRLLLAKRPNFCRTLAVSMGNEGPPRRPFCPTCSKAARTCICSRFPFPPLDNAISVSILLHSLEKNHPLNSTRVAKLGLKNIEVFPVTDVNFRARLLIRPLEHAIETPEKPEAEERMEFSNDGVKSDCNGRSSAHSIKFQDPLEISHSHPSVTSHRYNPFSSLSKSKRLHFDQNGDCPLDEDNSITITSDKFMVTCSSSDIQMLVERSTKPKIDWVLETPIGKAAISNGFVVSKLQRKELRPSKEFEDFKEFEIVVPPGAALLFPSDRAISLKAVDFDVKHLIVLDGTWAKAKRIYHENPWLQLLPHLKLDLRRKSLYAEVRHEPKAGFFSTIESIVCAMKELEGDTEGLDELLVVFRSMISDQRVCKDENFKGKSVLEL